MGAASVLFALTAVPVSAQVFPPDIPPPPGPLSQIPVPLPPNLSDFVVDINAAKVLGKAFFWDQQTGSDGIACASCHFHAGADNRVKNAMDPGLRNTDAAQQNIWQRPASYTSGPWKGGPNWTLRAADFPLHKLSDTTNRNSAVLYDSKNIVGSAGVFSADFNHINLLPQWLRLEVCKASLSPTFSIGGTNTRQVEPRNTPTVVNAIFNFRNFWDGRANNVFNGRNPFGYRDPTAGIDPLNSILVPDASGALVPYPVALTDASAASQAVGPPGSNLEMSCTGRLFENIGQKLLPAVPLLIQAVDRNDSLLAPYVNKIGFGLNMKYEALVKKAFNPKFWSSTLNSPDGYRQIEKNFSLFWGISIMLYESTLVSDQSPFDQYMSGNISAMTTQQVTGFTQVFMAKGGCVFCHKGAEFTGAATSLKTAQQLGGQIEHMIMGDGEVSLYDSGFYNIGVRPTTEDIGSGGLDPFGNPLNWSRQAKNAVGATGVTNLIGVGPDRVNVFTCNFQVDPCFPVTATERDSVDGSFKVPSLRNVELTGPYFHNGGQATLEQVVDFYARGGDGKGDDLVNTTGFHNLSAGLSAAGASVNNPTNRAPAIFPLPFLTAQDKANVVAFLKALTDERVRWEKAPFDHPSLILSTGHPVNELSVLKLFNSGYAVDSLTIIPAVGAAGRSTAQGPLQPFVAGLN